MVSRNKTLREKVFSCTCEALFGLGVVGAVASAGGVAYNTCMFHCQSDSVGGSYHFGFSRPQKISSKTEAYKEKTRWWGDVFFYSMSALSAGIVLSGAYYFTDKLNSGGENAKVE